MSAAGTVATGLRRAPAAVGLGLALLVAVAAAWLDAPLLLLLPAGLLALPVFGLRMLTRPVAVLAAYIVVSVNLDFFRFGAVDISLHIIVSALLLWGLLVRLSLESHRPLRHPVERAFAVFLLATLVSVILSVDVGRSLKNWFRDVEYLILFSFLAGHRLNEVDRRTLAGAIVLSSIIPCLAGLAGILFDVPALYGLDTPIAGGETIRRVFGTLRHPVSLSIYLALTMTMTLSLLLHGRWFRRTYLLALLLLQITVLYLTFGRTGWIVMFVATAALLLLSGHRRWVLLGLPAMIGAIALLLPKFLARWQTIGNAESDSFLWRIGLWAYTLTLVPQRPWFGSGPDTFTEYVAYGPGRPSHQTWVGLTLETGIVGVAAFLALMITTSVLLRRRVQRPEWRLDPIARATAAGFTGILVGSLGENPFEVPVIATLVWILLAVTLNDASESAPDITK